MGFFFWGGGYICFLKRRQNKTCLRAAGKNSVKRKSLKIQEKGKITNR